MQRTRSAVSVDQSVSSKARRAASIARPISSCARIGGDAQHLFGGRVDRRERARAARHELPVDEQLTLAIGQHPHSDSRFDRWTSVRISPPER